MSAGQIVSVVTAALSPAAAAAWLVACRLWGAVEQLAESCVAQLVFRIALHTCQRFGAHACSRIHVSDIVTHQCKQARSMRAQEGASSCQRLLASTRRHFHTVPALRNVCGYYIARAWQIVSVLA